jgi:hypothetical protein
MTGIGVLLVRTSALVVWVRCNCARNSMTAPTPRLDKGLPMMATRDNRRFTELVFSFDDPASALRALLFTVKLLPPLLARHRRCGCAAAFIT